MGKSIVIKRGDTKPTFVDVPKIDGEYILFAALAGCTLSFLLKGVTTVKRAADIASVTIESQAVAQFRYDPISADVENVGKCRQEWELVFPGGKILTFPNDGYNEVKIVADLG